MHDRRKTGVNQVTLLEEDSGAKIKVVTATAKRMHVWIVLFLSLAALFTVISGAVKWGVNVGVKDIIEAEAIDENSRLSIEMHEAAKEEISEFNVMIHQEDFDSLEQKMGEIGTAVAGLNTGQEVQQIQIENMKTEIEGNQTEILRMLHEAANDRDTNG